MNRELDRLGRALVPHGPDGRWITDPAPDPCRNCGAGRAGKARGFLGLCLTCERRWADAGYPATGVPVPAPSRGGFTGGRDGTAGRIEDYLILRHERGLTAAEAALALGLTRRTLRRYDAALRAGAA